MSNTIRIRKGGSASLERAFILEGLHDMEPSAAELELDAIRDRHWRDRFAAYRP
jgi:hypothetical protein